MIYWSWKRNLWHYIIKINICYSLLVPHAHWHIDECPQATQTSRTSEFLECAECWQKKPLKTNGMTSRVGSSCHYVHPLIALRGSSSPLIKPLGRPCGQCTEHYIAYARICRLFLLLESISYLSGWSANWFVSVAGAVPCWRATGRAKPPARQGGSNNEHSRRYPVKNVIASYFYPRSIDSIYDPARFNKI